MIAIASPWFVVVIVPLSIAYAFVQVSVLDDQISSLFKLYYFAIK